MDKWIVALKTVAMGVGTGALDGVIDQAATGDISKAAIARAAIIGALGGYLYYRNPPKQKRVNK